MSRNAPSQLRERHYLRLGSKHQRNLPTFAEYQAIAAELGISPQRARNLAMVALGKIVEAAQAKLEPEHVLSDDSRTLDRWDYAT